MRIEITQPGIFNAKGEAIAVGTELTVKSEPKAWEGRYRILAGKGEGKTAVTNDEPSKNAAEVLALADGNFMAFKAAATKLLGAETPAKKEEIRNAVIDKLSDDELKSYLGTKGVTTTDETREQLVELAKAA